MMFPPCLPPSPHDVVTNSVKSGSVPHLRQHDQPWERLAKRHGFHELTRIKRYIKISAIRGIRGVFACLALQCFMAPTPGSGEKSNPGG
jgi:hypothetical protein